MLKTHRFTLVAFAAVFAGAHLLPQLFPELFVFGLANANRDSDAITTKISVIRAIPGAPVSHAKSSTASARRMSPPSRSA